MIQYLAIVMIGISTTAMCQNTDLSDGQIYDSQTYRKAYDTVYESDAFIVAAHGWTRPLVFDTTDAKMLELAFYFRERIKALTGEIVPFVDTRYIPTENFIVFAYDHRPLEQPEYTVSMKKRNRSVNSQSNKSISIGFSNLENARRALDVLINKIQLGGNPKFANRVGSIPWEFTDIQVFREK